MQRDVERYLDPSQFPQVVEIDGPLYPGEAVFQKDPRTKERNIVWGVKGMERQVAHAAQDLEAARNRALLEFRGGFQSVSEDDRRGKGGTWHTSKVTTDTGPGALTKAQAMARGSRIMSADSLEAVGEQTPRHLEVQRLRQGVRVWPGAEGYEKQAKDFEQAVPALETRLEEAERNAGRVEAAARQAQADLEQAERERVDVRREVARLEAEVRRWARLIGEHDARQAAIRDLSRRIADLQHRLAVAREYLRMLQDALKNKPKEPKPPVPGGPDDKRPSLWRYLVALAVFGIVLFSLWHIVTRRGKRQNPALTLQNAPLPGPFGLDTRWISDKVKALLRRD